MKDQYRAVDKDNGYYFRGISSSVLIFFSLLYTGQKKLSPTCIFPIDKVQKHSDLSYCNFLLDVNFQTQFSTK